MNITLQIENWHDFYADAKPLIATHYEEIGEDAVLMPLNLEESYYEMMQANNLVQIVTARKDGALIGYCFFVLANNVLSKDVLCGYQGPYYLAMEERKNGVGLSLYRKSIRHMKERGVQNIYPHHYMRGGSEALGAFFESLGAKEVMREYSLWIGD